MLYLIMLNTPYASLMFTYWHFLTFLETNLPFYIGNRNLSTYYISYCATDIPITSLQDIYNLGLGEEIACAYILHPNLN